MDGKLFEELDGLDIGDTNLLLDKDIKLSIDSFTRKRIEKSIKKKTGYYSENNIHKNKIKDILGTIIMKKNIALALSVGVILSLAGGGYAYAKAPIAYVSMDINPSVELGVNAFDKVVSVEAYNEDGKKILEGTNLLNSNVNDAVSTVISNSISDGYIKADGSSSIEITTSTDKESVATELDDSLKKAAEETLSDNKVEAEIESEKVTLARRDEARKLGITPGKLNLIQKLQELDPTISVEDYKFSSVKDIQKKTKELRKNNKFDETMIDNSISTEIDKDTNTDIVNEENTKEATLSKTTADSEGGTSVETKKNNNSSNNKDKKEENSNANEEKKTVTINEKQNNGKNVNSEDIINSSKEGNSSNSDVKKNGRSNSESKSNNGSSSKPDNSSDSLIQRIMRKVKIINKK
jgi:hypothetical protein